MDAVAITKHRVHVSAKWRMGDEGWQVDLVIRHLDELKVERIPLDPDAAAVLADELVSTPALTNGHP
jgi:hypothetical protein